MSADLELVEAAERAGVLTHYEKASLYAWLGENDRALEQLENAVATRSSDLVFLKVEPAFRALDGDRRFDDILRRVGLPTRSN